MREDLTRACYECGSRRHPVTQCQSKSSNFFATRALPGEMRIAACYGCLLRLKTPHANGRCHRRTPVWMFIFHLRRQVQDAPNPAMPPVMLQILHHFSERFWTPQVDVDAEFRRWLLAEAPGLPGFIRAVPFFLECIQVVDFNTRRDPL